MIQQFKAFQMSHLRVWLQFRVPCLEHRRFDPQLVVPCASLIVAYHGPLLLSISHQFFCFLIPPMCASVQGYACSCVGAPGCVADPESVDASWSGVGDCGLGNGGDCPRNGGGSWHVAVGTHRNTAHVPYPVSRVMWNGKRLSECLSPLELPTTKVKQDEKLGTSKW